MNRPDDVIWSDRLYGCVDDVTTSAAVGWVVGPSDRLPVRLGLFLDELQVRSAWADQPSGANTAEAARSFSIPLRGIWDFCEKTTQVSVRVDGVPLPMAKRGIYKRPANAGSATVAELRQMMDEGYVFNDEGKLQLSKKLDLGWQETVVDLYERVCRVLEERHGYDAFVMYGSLLGQVREQGFIAHDNDFDMAYLSKETDGRAAAAELRDIGFTLIDAGFDVETRRTALHIHDEDDRATRVDLFHTYFDDDGRLRMPFGRASQSELTRDEWDGTEMGRMGEHSVRIPKRAERWVEHIYGESWNVPTPGFHWDRARVAHAQDGRLPEEFREAGYWANFYAHNEYTDCSTFCEFVENFPDIPRNVIDIGCGDGRDAFAFANNGRRTLGLDRSHVGIDNASKKAVDGGLGSRLTFEVADVSDAEHVGALIGAARERADGGSILFYLRFFLHSIPGDVQERLMSAISANAVAGDALAAEFRTDKDESRKKVHGQHYRRFQSMESFTSSLTGTYGFDVEFEVESTGLSPYKGEDPYICRVIARKRR